MPGMRHRYSCQKTYLDKALVMLADPRQLHLKKVAVTSQPHKLAVGREPGACSGPRLQVNNLHSLLEQMVCWSYHASISNHNLQQMLRKRQLLIIFCLLEVVLHCILVLWTPPASLLWTTLITSRPAYSATAVYSIE
jgi:hypothetical protein